MNAKTTDEGPAWFRALLDTAPDVYFRYSLAHPRRFEYLSPSVHALTGHAADDFLARPALCFDVIVREDRRVLRQILRARRGLSLTLRAMRGDALVAVDVRTVAIIRNRQVVAVEGVARELRVAVDVPAVRDGELPSSPAGGLEPTQQRLAALMYEVHDLLHRALPPQLPSPRPTDVLRFGDVEIDNERLTVTESGKAVTLTMRETLLLRYLIQHAGRVVTRGHLLTEVWGNTYTGDDRTVDVHVSRLRRKLTTLRRRLVAVKHVGYRLDGEEPASTSPERMCRHGSVAQRISNI
jgi:DNA-binding winged helix-turn-helix (wHTH) protein